MPDSLPHRCNFPRCPSLTHERMCAEHRGERDKRRGSDASRKFYASSRWKRERLAFLREHPVCQCDECAELPAFARPAATVVDHIIPHDGDYELMWDSAHNWMAMTKPHHDAKTAREDGAFGRGRIDKRGNA